MQTLSPNFVLDFEQPELKSLLQKLEPLVQGGINDALLDALIIDELRHLVCKAEAELPTRMRQAIPHLN